MAKQKNRQVVNDLSNIQFNPPKAGSGGSLPGFLNVRTTTRSQSNSIMESFSGFSKAITNLGAVREKNEAAQELIEARNAALQGKYKSFDRQASLDAYNQTRGDIKGRSSAVQLTNDLRTLKNELLNAGGSLEDTQQRYEFEKSRLIEEKYGSELQSDEFFKSGFLPHMVKATDDMREELAKDYKAKFDSYTNSLLSEEVDQVASELDQFQVFDPSDPNGAGAAANKTAMDMTKFNNLVKTGMALGKNKEDARFHIITTLVAKAVEEGRPELLAFAKQSTDDGIILESNQVYNKMIDDGRKAATATMTRKLKAERTEAEFKYKEGRKNSLSGFYTEVAKDPTNPVLKPLLRNLASSFMWTPEEITKAEKYLENTSKGSHVTPDTNLEWELSRSIQEGVIDSEEYLSNLHSLSIDIGEGVDNDMYKKLLKRLEERKAMGEKASAYKRNRDFIKGWFGRGSGMVISDGKITTESKVSTQILEQFDEGLSRWYIEHPDQLMDSPEANQFFTDWRNTVMEAHNEFVTTTKEDLEFEDQPEDSVFVRRVKAQKRAERREQRLDANEAALQKVRTTHRFLLNE